MKASDLIAALTKCVSNNQDFEILIHNSSVGPKEIQNLLFINDDKSYDHNNAIVLIPKE